MTELLAAQISDIQIFDNNVVGSQDQFESHLKMLLCYLFRLQANDGQEVTIPTGQR